MVGKPPIQALSRGRYRSRDNYMLDISGNTI